jgi:hypothetical protein
MVQGLRSRCVARGFQLYASVAPEKRNAVIEFG